MNLRPVVAIVVAVIVTLALTQRDDRGDGGSEPEPVAVTSDAPRLSSLDALVEASDVVVRAEVVATEHGRVFGDPGGSSVESRVVTLAVDEVLAGEVPAGRLLVEEEGWLEDGAPLVVDGATGSATGDDGIWFLVDVGDADRPAYVVVSAEGRYLVDGTGLAGAVGDDPLVAALSALSVDELAARIVALPG